MSKDSRLFHDRDFQARTVSSIVSFFSNVSRPPIEVSINLFDPPVPKVKVMKLLEFLINRIDQKLLVDRLPLEQGINDILAELQYPYVFPRSSLMLIGAPNTWPNVLGMLGWLTDVARVGEAVEAKGSDFVLADHALHAYSAWMNEFSERERKYIDMAMSVFASEAETVIGSTKSIQSETRRLKDIGDELEGQINSVALVEGQYLKVENRVIACQKTMESKDQAIKAIKQKYTLMINQQASLSKELASTRADNERFLASHKKGLTRAKLDAQKENLKTSEFNSTTSLEECRIARERLDAIEQKKKSTLTSLEMKIKKVVPEEGQSFKLNGNGKSVSEVLGVNVEFAEILKNLDNRKKDLESKYPAAENELKQVGAEIEQVTLEQKRLTVSLADKRKTLNEIQNDLRGDHSTGPVEREVDKVDLEIVTCQRRESEAVNELVKYSAELKQALTAIADKNAEQAAIYEKMRKPRDLEGAVFHGEIEGLAKEVDSFRSAVNDQIRRGQRAAQLIAATGVFGPPLRFSN